MIVRISAEGQYELSDEQWRRLERLDDEAVAAVDASDEGSFRSIWNEILELVSGEGRQLDGDELVGSDLILPPRDVSFVEVRRDFSGDGLIPD